VYIFAEDHPFLLTFMPLEPLDSIGFYAPDDFNMAQLLLRCWLQLFNYWDD